MADDTSSERPDENAPETPGPGPSGPAGGPPDQEPPPPGAGGPSGGPSGPPPPPPPGVGEAEVSAMPPELQAANATKDERTWAMVGHLVALSGLFTGGVGNIVGPLVIWLLKKEESAYVGYHAKQSMWFQIFAMVAAFVLSLLGFILCFPFFLAMLIGIGAYVYAVVGAIQVSNSKDFEYYWVGQWVRTSM